jgi:hypothetical protein
MEKGDSKLVDRRTKQKISYTDAVHKKSKSVNMLGDVRTNDRLESNYMCFNRELSLK